LIPPLERVPAFIFGCPCYRPRSLSESGELVQYRIVHTAAGGARGPEALPDLARAFIYAQGRALLVSHWEVNSSATVKLIAGTMRLIAADKSMGRPEAMRQSVLALIEHGEPEEAHLDFWAPFVVAGEGGARNKALPLWSGRSGRILIGLDLGGFGSAAGFSRKFDGPLRLRLPK